jgi:integrase
VALAGTVTNLQPEESDVNFRNRVWQPAVAAAGVRRFPPRIMRHTAAWWLVMDGVPLYDVEALLGHESFATTQRHAHLAPDAHSRVIEAWPRRRGASVAHEARLGMPGEGVCAGGPRWT